MEIENPAPYIPSIRPKLPTNLGQIAVDEAVLEVVEILFVDGEDVDGFEQRLGDGGMPRVFHASLSRRQSLPILVDVRNDVFVFGELLSRGGADRVVSSQ